MNKVVYGIGYGIIKGTRTEKKTKFQERLRYIQRGIGKPLTVVDIRKKGSGSRNGKWFRQVSGLAVIDYHMFALVSEVYGVEYIAEPALANHWGGSKAQLLMYATDLIDAQNPDRDLVGMLDAFMRVVDIAKAGDEAAVLLCGCRDAFKKNGTTWNCHRVPLAELLVRELGDGWTVCHL